MIPKFMIFRVSDSGSYLEKHGPIDHDDAYLTETIMAVLGRVDRSNAEHMEVRYANFNDIGNLR